ncbi:MAG TPA: cation diffusion facilitator family transporter [Solirubrobacteraceae bacterium]|jgi:cation diffusion facilitator family transporter|nr:cation diffusion facilitator family transporter [Solirubrobacteraceae bacterium]
MSADEHPHSGLTQQRTAVISIAVAALLVAVKLGVGITTGSLGLISAGIESSGDVIAAVLTFFAVRLGGRPADRGHPYGHRRAENLGALGEAGILFAGAALVAEEAIRRLAGDHAAPEVRWYQFAVIALAIALDLSRARVSLVAAKRFDSPALRSNAAHFLADMAGSVAVLVGLLLAEAGVDRADPIAALVVAGIIVWAAVRLVTVNANVLMDRSPGEAQAAAERAVTRLGSDIELTRLRLRESAGRFFADVVVSVPAGQAVVEAHKAADRVEAAVEAALPGSDVVVHVEPRRRGLDLRERVLAIAMSEELVKEAHDITIFEYEGAASVSLHLKFPADLALAQAHEIAERVERAIAERPGVREVQTHLEPLERPLRAHGTSSRADEETVRLVEALVRGHTGSGSAATRLIATDVGDVLFLTVSVGAGESLRDAHDLAGELEDELRGRIEGLADVVVHTEP